MSSSEQSERGRSPLALPRRQDALVAELRDWSPDLYWDGYPTVATLAADAADLIEAQARALQEARALLVAFLSDYSDQGRDAKARAWLAANPETKA